MRDTTLSKFRGLKNLGSSCWLGSYLQAVAAVSDCSRAAEAQNVSDKQCVSGLLRPVMHSLSRGQLVPVRQLGLLLNSITSSLGRNPRGQDPHELHVRLASDPGLLNTNSSERSFPRSMQLRTQTLLVCQNCHVEHSVQFPENALPLSTTDREGRPLHSVGEALASFFSPELVGPLECVGCQRKTMHLKTVGLAQVGRVVVITLGRYAQMSENGLEVLIPAPGHPMEVPLVMTARAGEVPVRLVLRSQISFQSKPDHYVTFVVPVGRGPVVQLDDANVQAVSFQAMLDQSDGCGRNQFAYMLFYVVERGDASPVSESGSLPARLSQEEVVGLLASSPPAAQAEATLVVSASRAQPPVATCLLQGQVSPAPITTSCLRASSGRLCCVLYTYVCVCV